MAADDALSASASVTARLLSSYENQNSLIPTETMAAATSVPTTATYFQTSRRCGRAGVATVRFQRRRRLGIDQVGLLDDVRPARDAELRGSLQAEGELDLRHLLGGQVGGLGALQDAVDEPSRRRFRRARGRRRARTARPCRSSAGRPIRWRWAWTGRFAAAASPRIFLEKLSRRLGDRMNTPSTAPGVSDWKAAARPASSDASCSSSSIPSLPAASRASTRSGGVAGSSVGSTSVSRRSGCGSGRISR